MTGNGYNRRPGDTPDADHAAGVDDARLDSGLSAVADRLLVSLRAGINVDAGLAAVHARVQAAADARTAAAADPIAGHPSAPAAGPAEHGRVGRGPAGLGELEAVCGQLAGYLTDLDPVSDDRTSTPPGLGGSLLYLGAMHRMLQELQYGLLGRSLDRAGADRLTRLITHNASEAGQLLAGERRRASRRARSEIDSWTQTVTGIRGGITELRPRIHRLFDDADQATADQPRPRQPV